METCQAIQHFFRNVFFQEAKEFLKISFPIVVTYLLTFLIQLETLFCKTIKKFSFQSFYQFNNILSGLGDLGPDILAAAGLGNVWMNVSANSILFGLATALETLSSQANGAKNYPRVGILLQRSICISLVVVIPISIIWWFSGDIFILLKQDPHISTLSGLYIRFSFQTFDS